jgi:hypothetical protein
VSCWSRKCPCYLYHILPSNRKIRNTRKVSFFQLLKIIFPDSVSKTEYRQNVKSTIDSKICWWWRFESPMYSRVCMYLVSLRTWRSQIFYLVLFTSHHGTNHLFFSFLLLRKIVFTKLSWSKLTITSRNRAILVKIQ